MGSVSTATAPAATASRILGTVHLGSGQRREQVAGPDVLGPQGHASEPDPAALPRKSG